MPEFNGAPLATIRIPEPVRETNPLAWWLAFREHVQPTSSTQYRGHFAIAIELGSQWQEAGLSAMIKPMLDGLVSALHVHDGSSREHITAVLGQAGDGQRLWSLLNDPALAMLGERRLVRPHGARIAWNPADELCGSFRVIYAPHQDAVAATVLAIGESAVPSGAG